MSAEVVSLPMNRHNAQQRIREMAEGIKLTREIRRRMRERKISLSEVVMALQKGVITEGPAEDMKGCWKCTVERFGAGRSISVAVAICEDYLVGITTY